MILPDANLLLYSANRDCREHPAAFLWLEEILSGRESVGFCAPVISAFLRLSTHRQVLASPLTVEAAFGFVENWMSFPAAIWLNAEVSHLRTMRSLLAAAGRGGNLVTDAQIAAIAMDYGATVHTADLDFSRFPGVKWKNPLLR